MGDLFAKFKDFIDENNLLESGEKVILGVSGGPDSVFLFYMFHFLKKLRKNEFIVAHFNHSLRKEADSEEEFVRCLCSKHNIKFVSEKKNVKALFKGDSLEQTARNLRYDFFLKVARRYKIKKIALAHHKDDLVETVLLRILRGSGLLGLRGMLPATKYKKIILIRPLLFVEKEKILKFLSVYKIKYVVDKSNFQDKFLRNKIRLNLIPSLIKISPSFKNNLYNLARSIAWDYDFIYQKTRKILEEAVIYEDADILEINLEKLQDIHKSLLSNLVRLSIERAKGNLRRIDSKHIEKIFALLTKMPVNSVVDIPGLKVIKKDNSLKFKRVA